MLTRLLDALTRRLIPAAEDGHFHPGPRGPYPCHDARCSGARVTSGDRNVRSRPLRS